jgi:L-asparaginase type I
MVTYPDGTLRPPANPNDFLKVAPELKDIVDYDFVPLLNKDSTNMVPSDWVEMAREVYHRRNDGYTGFVIAHGTDTMHFSASALAFALGPGLNFPVVFTGAQTTPDVQHGDARVNLLRAVRVAKDDLAEVVIAFGDYVFRGCRTQKKDEKRFDAFESPALYPIADITEKILIHPTARRRSGADCSAIDLIAEFGEGLLQVGLIPGLKPELLEPVIQSNKCEGIVLQSFGAGNVPDENEYAFGDFIAKAVGRGIPVVITSQFPANSTLETLYAPGVAAVDAGAIPTGNMTSAAATVKFRWVLARVQRELGGRHPTDHYLSRIKDLMNETYILEMD